MKRLFELVVLFILLVGCQQQAPPDHPSVIKISKQTVKQQALKTTKASSVADSLSPAMLATLQRVDLSTLFLAPQSQQGAGYQSALDGFLGNNPERLSLAITGVSRDALRANLFRVTGKSRYKNQLARFEGTIKLSRISDFYNQGLLLSQGGDEFKQDTTTTGHGAITNARAYSAIGNFVFVNKAVANAYALKGQVFLDLYIISNGKIGTIHSPAEGIILDSTFTRGSGLLLKGTWRSSAIFQPFIVSQDIFLVANELIGDFGVGDRGAQVNPKYVKFGWNTYWENDEWWAETPKASISL